MRRTHIKARGIYATALTRLFLDMGYGIAQPSAEICERFQIPRNEAAGDISIIDRDDRQGIQVFGRENLVDQLIPCLWQALLDIVVRKEPVLDGSAESGEEQILCNIEFPGASKAVLDGLRARVLPTLRHHHRLRIIASEDLDLMEREIERTPHKAKRLEREFMDRFLYQPLKNHGVLRLEHVKPEGGILELREGEIVSLSEGELMVRRRFRKGRYDGLDLVIETGDYGITEVVEGAWSLAHRYFSKGGSLKGEYMNVNTPIELYPDRIRYVDLHVDVVRRGREGPRIIDQEKLESITRKGLISPRLQKKAIEISRHLLDQLSGAD